MQLRGRVRQLPSTIVGDQRRYEELGPRQIITYYALIHGLHLAGARMRTSRLSIAGLSGPAMGRYLIVTQPVSRDWIPSLRFRALLVCHWAFANSRAVFETVSEAR